MYPQIKVPIQVNKKQKELNSKYNGEVCVYSVAKLCPTLHDPKRTVALQAHLSMGFPRQEYWSGLPFAPRGHLPNPGIKPASPVSPKLADRFFTTEPPGKPWLNNADKKLIIEIFIRDKLQARKSISENFENSFSARSLDTVV